jgi:hypothetical protein
MLYELVAEGEIELVKIGRKSLVPADSLQRYVTRLRAALPSSASSGPDYDQPRAAG